MSPLDHLLWLTDRHANLRSAMSSVAVFEGPCDRDGVRSRFARACHRVPRLRRRVEHSVVSVAPPRWEIDPDFDVDRHLTFTPESGLTLREVLDRAGEMAGAALPTDRPLWYATVVDEVASVGLPDGSWALIMGAHHALTDGLGALEIQGALFDLDTGDTDGGSLGAPDPPSPDLLERSIDAALWEARRGFDLIDRGLGELGRAAFAPRNALRRATGTAASLGRTLQLARTPRSALMSGRGGGVRLDVIELRLAELRAAAQRYGTRLNAVFLAGFADGLRRYHRSHDDDIDMVHLGLPVSTRTDAAAGGNHILPVRVDLALSADGPAEHARAIEAAVDAARAEPALALLPDLLGATTLLPSPLVVGAYREALRGIDVLASNLTGSPVPARLAGSALIAQFPFGPLAAAACNLTLLSYCEHAHLGLSSCPVAVPDPDVLRSHLADGFAAVLDI